MVWEYSQLGFLTHVHLENLFFPAWDHLFLAQHKLEGLVSVPRGVELLPNFKYPQVVHDTGLTRFWEGVPISGRDGLSPALVW